MTDGHSDQVFDVAIVGGGIAGLAAAFDLQNRGLTVRVLEASSRVGGVIATERFDGWVIDGGPDSLLVQKPAAVTLCRELGIADRLVSTLTPRTAFVLRDGRLHAIAEGSFLGFPITFGALARSRLFTVGGKARMAGELLVPRRTIDEDESIGAFVSRRFGREAVDYLADPLLAGIHAGDVDRLSIRALFPRLVDAERRSGSVIRALRALHVRPSPQGAFVSLPGGTGELVDTLAKALPPGTVVTGARVTNLQRSGGYSIDSTAGRVQARSVVLAVPAYVSGSLTRPIDSTLADLCDEIPYASTATVAFGYRRDQVAHPLRGTGFVVPRTEGLALLAGTWVSSKWPGRAPEGHVLLRGFLGGGRDPRRLDASDEELVDIAQRELTDLLGISGGPLFSRLYRWTRQSPQYEVGHLHRITGIERRLLALPGLFVTGSGFKAIGIPDCISDGRATATRAADYVASLT
ncbi:MAG TPA: protoporphyrinogen oxidase [Vicinamibacterales bacterium]|nr:protoporphyrinogen oxidase [Vicinamibacterales bacterium]